MERVDWKVISNFKKSEFPCDPDKFVSPQIIHNLQYLRDIINEPIFPSPAPGALARTDEASKKSAHYSNPSQGIYSIAIDVFIQGYVFSNFYQIINSRLFERVGIYFDTIYFNQVWPMFHLDLRIEKKPTSLWYRDEHEYHFPLVEGFSFLVKKFNEYNGIYFEK